MNILFNLVYFLAGLYTVIIGKLFFKFNLLSVTSPIRMESYEWENKIIFILTDHKLKTVFISLFWKYFQVDKMV